LDVLEASSVGAERSGCDETAPKPDNDWRRLTVLAIAGTLMLGRYGAYLVHAVAIASIERFPLTY